MNHPKTLKLTPAYRDNSYSVDILLEESEEQPKAEAKFWNAPGGRLVNSELQPGELNIVKGNKGEKSWIAQLRIPNCKGLPEQVYIQIVVDGQVQWAGTLNVGWSTV